VNVKAKEMVARVLNLVPGGLHASDPLTEPAAPAPLSAPVAPVAPGATEFDAAAAALAADPRVAAALARIAATVTAEQDGPPPRVPIAADYRALPVFQATVRAACRAGMTGIGTRGVHPVIPLPDYGLDRFTAVTAHDGDDGDADDGDAGFGPEFDQVAERAEAGFYEARRVFHRADTAGFPAVTP
jgi:hypothetical protein